MENWDKCRKHVLLVSTGLWVKGQVQMARSRLDTACLKSSPSEEPHNVCGHKGKSENLKQSMRDMPEVWGVVELERW
eukprot:scaffold31546_cov20-Tisochrysis_lutea.AAC.1